MGFCTKCGAPIQQGAAFCAQCGLSLGAQPAPPAQAQPQPHAMAPQAYGGAQPQGGQPPQQPYGAPGQPYAAPQGTAQSPGPSFQPQFGAPPQAQGVPPAGYQPQNPYLPGGAQPQGFQPQNPQIQNPYQPPQARVQGQPQGTEGERPRPAGGALLFFGYLFALLGGLIGLALGSVVYSSKITDGRGGKVHKYTNRGHGLAMIIIAAVVWAAAISLRH